VLQHTATHWIFKQNDFFLKKIVDPSPLTFEEKRDWEKKEKERCRKVVYACVCVCEREREKEREEKKVCVCVCV